MGMTQEDTGILTTGDALVDGVLRGLGQSGRSETENFRALAKAVMWSGLSEVEGESPDMETARELMHNGALMFERAVKQAKAQAQAELEFSTDTEEV